MLRREWAGLYQWGGFKLGLARLEFDPHLITDFVSWEITAECLCETTNADLIYDFQAAMVTHWGENWLDTWYRSILEGGLLDDKRNLWVRGSLKPSSFVEFAMQVELLIFVKHEVEREISTNPETPRNPKLLYYALVGSALSDYDAHSPTLSLYHSPQSWQDFARFLLKNGFDANALLEISIAPDRNKLMNYCKRNEPVFETVLDGITSETQGGGDNGVVKTNGIENGKKDSSVISSEERKQGKKDEIHQSEDEDYQIDNSVNDTCRISILHLALAIACTDDEEYKMIPQRLDMLRVLVEEGGNPKVSNYSNYWSHRSDVSAERSAIHYLLSLDIGYIGSDEEEDLDISDALHNCIKAFLDHGADPNATDSNGISILELAVSSSPYRLVELMLTKGAKVTPKLLLNSGAPRLDAGGILNELCWRKPECYTPEARRIAIKYNTDWPTLDEIDVDQDEDQDSEAELVSSDNVGNVLERLVGSVTTSMKSWTSKLV
jgi:Ankyrin repeat